MPVHHGTENVEYERSYTRAVGIHPEYFNEVIRDGEVHAEITGSRFRL
jgi:hypothetical protein